MYPLSRGARRPRSLCLGLLFLVLGAAWISIPGAASASDADPAIVRVEEDWELVVKSTDENSAGPQIVCTIAPINNVDEIQATFELNHRSLPQFAAGGVQLQTWDGEWPIDSHKFPNGNLLSHANEVICWTQCMRLKDGTLTFEILHGSSQTWGDFGGQGYLKSSLSTDLSNLNGYNPYVSRDNSGVSFGGNLVSSLVLKNVRVFTSDGQMSEFAVNLAVPTGG